MVCLNPKTKNDSVESVASVLATDKNGIVNITDTHRDLAENMLACNNGFFPEFDPNGKTSELYRSLANKYGETLAVQAKSYIYTEEFASKYGNWLSENKPEPMLEDVEKEEFEQYIKDIFGKDPSIDTEDVKQFFIDTLYRSELGNGNFDDHIIFKDGTALQQTLSEMRDVHVEQYLDSVEDEIQNQVDEIIKDKELNGSSYDRDSIEKQVRQKYTYKAQSDFYRTFVNDQLTSIRSIFAKAWDLKIKDDGSVENPHKPGDKLYNIYQIRCNVINTLLDRQDNPDQIPVILSLIKNHINGAYDGKSVSTMIGAMFDEYADLLKNTDYITKALVYCGKLKKNKDGVYSKQDIDAAIGSLRKNIVRESKKYAETNTTIQSNFERFYEILINCVHAALYGIGYVSRKSKKLVPLAAGIAAGAYFGGTVALTIGGGLLGIVLGEKLSDYSIENFGESWNVRKQYHKALFNVISAISACSSINNLDSYLDSIDQIENDGEFANELDKKFIRSAVDGVAGDSLMLALYQVRNNLRVQIASLKNPKNQYESDQLAQARQLLNECEDALKSDYANRFSLSNNFFTSYINAVSTNIAESLDYIRQFSKRLDDARSKDGHDISDLDISRLMFIKTDVIGAYTNVISRYIEPNMLSIPLSSFKSNGYLNNTIRGVLLNQIKRAQLEFDKVLKAYCKYQIKEFLKETAGRVIAEDYGQSDNKLLKNFENNMMSWLSSEINNKGTISFFGRITPARSNISPIIRMIHQRLEEIYDSIEKEANAKGAVLEYIRTSTRSMGSRINPLNVMNKYAERDDKGRFTGFFKSDVNRGQYIADLTKEREFLFKKHGVLVDHKGRPIFTGTETMTEEEQWFAFNSDLVKWMGGVTRDKDGNYEDLDEYKHTPRCHRRFKPQYYIDKMRILGKEGTYVLADINSQIALIQRDCMQEITYTDSNGKQVTKKVPILSKLSPSNRNKLRSLMNRKQLLSSPTYFEMDPTYTRITRLVDKSEHDQQLALRFFEWDQKKQSYYNSDQKPSYELFEAVKQKYEEDLSKLNPTSPEYLKLENEYRQFLKDSTITTFSHKLMDKINKKGKRNYDMTDPINIEFIQLLNTRRAIRKQIESTNATRTLDLRKLGSIDYGSTTSPTDSDKRKTAQLWKQLVELDYRISKLYGDTLYTEEKAPYDKTKKSSKEMFDKEMVPLLDDSGNPKTDSRGNIIPFKNALLNKLGTFLTDAQLKYYRAASTFPSYASFLRQNTPSKVAFQVTGAKQLSDLFEDIPTGIFSESQSIMADEKFDNQSEEYYQINKNFTQQDSNSKPYDNSKEFDKIKNDKTYQALLDVMDESWQNYSGLTRHSRYSLPQREAELKSLWGRPFRQGKNFFSALGDSWDSTIEDFKGLNTRDEENSDDVISRADGSVVEFIPMRWVNRLSNPNRIDTDLVSSVIDFYTESLKYKYRTKAAPMMEALYFQLTGGYGNPQQSTSQSEIVRGEIQRAIYGKDVTGFGHNGNLTKDDLKYAKYSKMFRSALHSRLMSHNWNSVFKNGWDSFCNLLQATFTGKYIMTRNVIKALGRLFWDPSSKNPQLFTQIIGMNRSKATNMTQALMQLNGLQSDIHTRYKDQNKYSLTRLLEGSGSLEFEFVDYTTKAIITEAVYDAYRLVYNPVTHKYQFLNEVECETAYLTTESKSREEGYKVWCNSKVTLRDAYKHDKKTGLADFVDELQYYDANQNKTVVLNKEGLLDIIRPKSNISFSDDGRSRTLETKIRTTVRQMSSTINGMLNKEDKCELAKNWAGSIIVAFRGWMIAQSGEFFKTGSDFYNWETDQDVRMGLSDMSESFKLIKGLADKDFEGQYSFATGTFDVGLHVALGNNLKRNMGTLFLTFTGLSNFEKNHKFKALSRSKNMSVHDYYQIRNFSMALHSMIITIMLTCYTLAQFMDGDGNGDDAEEFKKNAYLSAYVAMLSSISERFPQLGTYAFLSGIMDIVNSATVGVTLFDDFHFVWDTAMNLSDLLDSFINRDSTVLQDNGTFDYIMNGSFVGDTKFNRNVTKGGTLLASALNIDTLPMLLSMDLLGYYLPDEPEFSEFKDTNFRDFNLNYRKSTNPNSKKAVAKWYGDLIPTNAIGAALQKTDYPIIYKKPQQTGYKSVKIKPAPI